MAVIDIEKCLKDSVEAVLIKFQLGLVKDRYFKFVIILLHI